MLGSLSFTTYFIFWGRISHGTWNHRFCSTGWPPSPRDPFVPNSPALSLQHTQPCPALLCGYWGSGIQTILKLLQWALHQLSQLPSPRKQVWKGKCFLSDATATVGSTDNPSYASMNTLIYTRIMLFKNMRKFLSHFVSITTSFNTLFCVGKFLSWAWISNLLVKL